MTSEHITVNTDDIEQAIESIDDDEVLSGLSLSECLIVAVKRAHLPIDLAASDSVQTAQSIRQNLRECWATWADRVSLDMAGPKPTTRHGDRKLTLLKALVWSGVRFGLAPGYSPMQSDEYARWILDTPIVRRFLDQTLRNPTIEEEQKEDWIDQLQNAHRLGPRNHLIDLVTAEPMSLS